MPRWGGRWPPSPSVSDQYPWPLHTLASRVVSQVSQSVPPSVSQSIVPSVTKVALVLLAIPNHYTTRCNTTCFLDAVCLGCHNFLPVRRFITCAFMLVEGTHVTPQPNRPCRPPALPSAVPFFLQHPSNIYNDFGAAWPRLVELYILSAEPEPLLSSSFVRVPHDTTLGSLLNR